MSYLTHSALSCFVLALALCAATACNTASPEPVDTLGQAQGHQTVVVVHGMGRTGLSMYLMSSALEERGYEVVNWGYSSTCCSIAELGQQLADELDELEPRPERLHFVGHSLGGIIIRWVLHHRPPAEDGRAVMLASPNQGSATADTYVEWGSWLLEPLDELTTDETSTVRQLANPQGHEIGTIAGAHDGKVSPEEARLPNEADHAVVPAEHTFIMNRSDVHYLVATFLETGHF
jgi:triacylglycerol lipase